MPLGGANIPGFRFRPAKEFRLTDAAPRQMMPSSRLPLGLTGARGETKAAVELNGDACHASTQIL